MIEELFAQFVLGGCVAGMASEDPAVVRISRLAWIDLTVGGYVREAFGTFEVLLIEQPKLPALDGDTLSRVAEEWGLQRRFFPTYETDAELRARLFAARGRP